MANELVPMSDIEKMGNAIAKSGLFGMKTPEQAIALMLIAQAEGMHPAIAARDYHVIQGRPALKADAMLARFQAAGGKVEWKVYTDAEVTGVFSHPSGGSVSLTWTLEQAKKIGLAGKDNWKNYPRAMLRARVVSEGIRTVYPGCVVGVYTPEEVQDFDEKPSRRAEKVIPAEIDADVVESIDVATGEITEDWPFRIPGKEAVTYGSKLEWIDALLMLCDKVMSSKLIRRDQEDKITQLKKENILIFQRIGLVESAKIYKDISDMFPREATEDEKKQLTEFVQNFGDKTQKS